MSGYLYAAVEMAEYTNDGSAPKQRSIASDGEGDVTKQILFSVVIPVYNRCKIVPRAILSVLAQEIEEDFEVIVVDDGSEDSIELTIENISDSRVTLIRQQNQGGGAARNRGICHANGRYIAFLDSDDYFLPGKLEAARDALLSQRASVFYSAVSVYRGKQSFALKPHRALLRDERVDEYLFCSGGTMQTSALVVESALAKSVLFDPSLRKGQDLDFVFRLWLAGATFVFDERPLVVWTDDSDAGRVSHTPRAEMLAAWLARNEERMSRNAALGFRANVLSYELRGKNSIRALGYIISAYMQGAQTARRSVHSLVRLFAPRKVYRWLVNYLIRQKSDISRM